MKVCSICQFNFFGYQLNTRISVMVIQNSYSLCWLFSHEWLILFYCFYNPSGMPLVSHTPVPRVPALHPFVSLPLSRGPALFLRCFPNPCSLGSCPTLLCFLLPDLIGALPFSSCFPQSCSLGSCHIPPCFLLLILPGPCIPSP